MNNTNELLLIHSLWTYTEYFLYQVFTAALNITNNKL